MTPVVHPVPEPCCCRQFVAEEEDADRCANCGGLGTEPNWERETLERVYTDGELVECEYAGGAW